MKFQDKHQTEKSCAKCGPNTKLIVRTNNQNDSQFLGCPNWPQCLYTTAIPQDMIMIAAGAQKLPGF